MRQESGKLVCIGALPVGPTKLLQLMGVLACLRMGLVKVQVVDISFRFVLIRIYIYIYIIIILLYFHFMREKSINIQNIY